jgi:hypothetical protein
MSSSLLAVGEPRHFTRNTVRDVDVLRHPLLIKRMPNHQEARAERLGWQVLRDHYPVPRLHARLRLPGSSLLVYERWGFAARPKTFLDILNDGDHAAIDAYMRVLTATYRAVILRTADLADPRTLVGKLYHDRAAPGGRLDTYYTGRDFQIADVHVQELADYTLVINGRERRLDWAATLSWLSTWATDPTPQWSAITQGDPTDVNLAVPFALFDYDTAGRNAVCGEFANFCWYTGFLGGYIVPRANPAAFAASPETFEQIPLNTPSTRAITKDETARRLTIDLVWRPAPARQAANRLYWHNVVVPIWKQLAGDEEINNALRPYLALRILGVFNLADLDPLDRLALIACLAECLAEDFDAERLLTQGLT